MASARTHDVSQRGVTTLLDLPTEVILLILSAVEAGDILNIRKTCKALRDISEDRALWLDIYFNMAHQRRYVLPGAPSDELLGLLTRQELESLTLSLQVTERRWTLLRDAPTLLEAPGSVLSTEESMRAGTSILSMSILTDRWLIVLFQGDVLEIWDLCPNSGDSSAGITKGWHSPEPNGTRQAECKIVHSVQVNGPCSMSAVTLGEDGRSIIMAVGSQVQTQVLRFNLSKGEAASCEHLAAFETPSPLWTVRALDPTTHTVVYSHAVSICFVNWSTKKYCTVTSETEDEELWSSIIGVSLLTSHHVLCVNTRSVEVYTLDFVEDLQRPLSRGTEHNPLYLYNIGQRPAVTYEHSIPGVTLRGVSFSQPETTRDADTQRVAASLMAYDVLRGLFHFSVVLTLPPAPWRGAPVPLDVACTVRGAHHMAQLVPLADLVDGRAPPRSGYTPGSRGFISACALGARGRRGVWIERKRNNMGRTVFGFAAADARAPPGREDAEPEIAPRCIYEVRNSVDLRDDLTHCAFSEVTGKIVLGTRRGQVLLL